jgi:hypothetical protein
MSSKIKSLRRKSEVSTAPNSRHSETVREPTLADAILGRLVDHSHRIEFNVSRVEA